MSTWLIILTVVVVLVLAVAGTVLRRRKFRAPKLNIEQFQSRWKDAQQFCRNEETWPLAIIHADKLVEDALKKRHYKGRTMGEKLVAAQHDIQDNETIWFAHKLRNKLVHEDLKKLKKKEVMDALIGFREALRDLGALERQSND